MSDLRPTWAQSEQQLDFLSFQLDKDLCLKYILEVLTEGCNSVKPRKRKRMVVKNTKFSEKFSAKSVGSNMLNSKNLVKIIAVPLRNLFSTALLLLVIYRPRPFLASGKIF